jgi:micrococcal nuclease
MRISKNRVWLVAFFVAFLLLVRLVSEVGLDTVPADRFKVIDIIDGDTVELKGGDRLRLIGIDCPERDEPYYQQAKEFLAELTKGKAAAIAFSERRRDGHGRLLGYMYIDSAFVNAEMVRMGLAYVYLFRDNLTDEARITALLSAQNEAIEEGRGLWSIKRHEEPYYLAKKGALRFHRPTCRAVRDLPADECIRFNTRLEAFRQGYSPCRNCRP